MRPMLPRRLFCSTVHKPEPRSSLRRLKWSCSMFIVLFHQKLLFHGLTFFGNFGGGTVGVGYAILAVNLISPHPFIWSNIEEVIIVFMF